MIAISGPSGSGKTRLVARLLPALAARGLRVAYLKHTGHVHPFDVPGKDTDVARRAGAVAAAIEGPEGMAYFGPPLGRISALVDLLPAADLVVAEGWKRAPLDKVEVFRPSVSERMLCEADRRVIAVVTDAVPASPPGGGRGGPDRARPARAPRGLPVFHPDDADGLAAFLAGRLARRTRRRRARRSG